MAGYTKIVQYGDKLEHYEYSMPLRQRRERYVSAIQRKRKKERTKLKIERTRRSIYRSKVNFYRLCHHNNTHAESIAFLTLTFADDQKYKDALRYVAHFFQRIKKGTVGKRISYIAVPELTKKGRYHFHCLVYDLPTEIAGDPISIWQYNRSKRRYEFIIATTERFTRNLQRQFRQGYLDIRLATYTSEGIAGYMAKYMGKFLTDTKLEAVRGYNCSRNIKKIGVYGSNKENFNDHIAFYSGIDVDTGYGILQQLEYDTQYMGHCIKSVYEINK